MSDLISKKAPSSWGQENGLISRQTAIDALIERDPNCGIDSAEVIKELPSAQPEIIMCKDCKQFRDHRCVKADHYVSGWGNCMDVFGAERREE